MGENEGFSIEGVDKHSLLDVYDSYLTGFCGVCELLRSGGRGAGSFSRLGIG